MSGSSYAKINVSIAETAKCFVKIVIDNRIINPLNYSPKLKLIQLN